MSWFVMLNLAEYITAVVNLGRVWSCDPNIPCSSEFHITHDPDNVLDHRGHIGKGLEVPPDIPTSFYRRQIPQ